eukprot:781722-Amorphochlora_amoeboformis.AAC.1
MSVGVSWPTDVHVTCSGRAGRVPGRSHARVVLVMRHEHSCPGAVWPVTLAYMMRIIYEYAY